MTQAKNRQSSVVFARGTKMADGQAQGARDSQAWAGVLMAEASDDDSDSSDDEVPQPRIPPPASSNEATSSRASWTSRAAAVGSRPPDTASQNPPTLKLLGLKSLKEGGAPLANPGPTSPALEMRQQVERRQQQRGNTPSPAFDMVSGSGAGMNLREPNRDNRIQSSSDYGDDARHGSYIHFGGTDGFGGRHDSHMPAPSSQQAFQLHDPPVQPSADRTLQPPRRDDGQPQSPRTALTHQLGLADTSRAASPHMPPSNSNRSLESTGFYTRSISPAGSASSTAQQRNLVSPADMSQNRASSPYAPAPPPNSVGVPLERGPVPLQRQPPQSLRPAQPHSPQPLSLPSPVREPPGERVPPHARLPGPRQPPQGFSDAPGRASQRQSIFRKSMAFITGGSSNTQGGPRQPGPQRQSLFRKSVALLTGRGGGQPSQIPSESDDDDANAPQPRVQGFVEEKPKNRKSHYLGGGGMGDEWDVNGYGARFWKRFSRAQHAFDSKESEEIRRKVERRRKLTLYLSLLGGVLIIAAVVGIVIWRESVPSKNVPGALDRQKFGAGTEQTPANQNEPSESNSSSSSSTNNDSTGGDTAASTQSTGTTSSSASSKKKKKHRKHRKNKDNDRRRQLSADSNLQDVAAIRRHVEHIVDSARMVPVRRQELNH